MRRRFPFTGSATRTTRVAPPHLRAIIEALEPAPSTPAVFFSDHDLDIECEADNVLISMLRHGLLTWDTLKLGFDALRADRDTENAMNKGKEGSYVDLPLPVYTKVAE